MKITMYCPTKDKSGTPISYDIGDHVARVFSWEYGGATVLAGKGFYRNNRGIIEVENVTLVTTFADSYLAPIKTRALAELIRDKWNQQSVLYEIDGISYFIERGK